MKYTVKYGSDGSIEVNSNGQTYRVESRDEHCIRKLAKSLG